MTVSTAGEENDHSHSRQVGEYSTVQSLRSPLLGSAQWTCSNSSGNSTARNTLAVAPNAQGDAHCRLIFNTVPGSNLNGHQQRNK